MTYEDARVEEPRVAAKLGRGEALSDEDLAALAAYLHSEGGGARRRGGWAEDAWQNLMVAVVTKLRRADADAWWAKYRDPRYLRAAHKHRIRDIERAERVAARAHRVEPADGAESPEEVAAPLGSAERALVDRELRTGLAAIARAWHEDLQKERPLLDGRRLTPQRAALWTILAGEVARWLEGASDAPVGAPTLATLEHRANPARTRSRLPNASYDAICEALEAAAPKLAVRYPKEWSLLGDRPVPSPGTLGQRFDQGAHEWRRRRDGHDPLEPWAMLLPWPLLLLHRERGWVALAGVAAVLALFVGGSLDGRSPPGTAEPALPTAAPALATSNTPALPSTATPVPPAPGLSTIAPPERASVTRAGASRPAPPRLPAARHAAHREAAPAPSPPPVSTSTPDTVATVPPAPAAVPAAVAAPEAPTGRLGDEAAALQRAREQVTAGNPVAALALLEAWGSRFPDGQLGAEAEAWRWRALEASGSLVEAGALALELLRAGRHPHLEAALRTTVARAAVAEGRCDDLLFALDAGPRLGARLERAGRRCRQESAR